MPRNEVLGVSAMTKVWVWAGEHKRSLMWAFGLVAVAAAAIFVFRFGFADRPSEQNIVAEWNDTIRKLGIEPVFPPEEDLYVGDLLAVIVNDTHPGLADAQTRPLLNRAIKLAHLDLSKDLIENYRMLPFFPPTTERPSETGKAWIEAPSSSGIFTPPDVRQVLAIAAFPGFSIQHQRNIAGGLSYLLKGQLGAAEQNADDIELNIPFAETYGVPSLLANYRLNLYCADPFNKDVCSDKTLRTHLGFVADGMFDTFVDPETHERRYRADVQLALVNRVYMTRAIEQKRMRGGDRSANLKVSSADGEQQAPTVAPPADPAPSANPPSSQDLMKKSLPTPDRLTAQGELSSGQSWNANLGLKETFERPITFGYRAVKIQFFTDLNRPNLAPGQQ
jgi:hypothetical protein